MTNSERPSVPITPSDCESTLLAGGDLIELTVISDPYKREGIDYCLLIQNVPPSLLAEFTRHGLQSTMQNPCASQLGSAQDKPDGDVSFPSIDYIANYTIPFKPIFESEFSDKVDENSLIVATYPNRVTVFDQDSRYRNIGASQAIRTEEYRLTGKPLKEYVQAVSVLDDKSMVTDEYGVKVHLDNAEGLDGAPVWFRPEVRVDTRRIFPRMFVPHSVVSDRLKRGPIDSTAPSAGADSTAHP